MLKILIIAIIAATTAASSCSCDANGVVESIIDKDDEKFEEYKEAIYLLNNASYENDWRVKASIKDCSTWKEKEHYVITIKISWKDFGAYENYEHYDAEIAVDLDINDRKLCLSLAETVDSYVMESAENLEFVFIDNNGVEKYEVVRNTPDADWICYKK